MLLPIKQGNCRHESALWTKSPLQKVVSIMFVDHLTSTSITLLVNRGMLVVEGRKAARRSSQGRGQAAAGRGAAGRGAAGRGAAGRGAAGSLRGLCEGEACTGSEREAGGRASATYLGWRRPPGRASRADTAGSYLDVG